MKYWSVILIFVNSAAKAITYVSNPSDSVAPIYYRPLPSSALNLLTGRSTVYLPFGFEIHGGALPYTSQAPAGNNVFHKLADLRIVVSSGIPTKIVSLTPFFEYPLIAGADENTWRPTMLGTGIRIVKKVNESSNWWFKVYFVGMPDNFYFQFKASNGRLYYTVDRGWKTELHYTSSGKLTWIKDRHLNLTDLDYSNGKVRYIHSMGKTYTFNYSASNNLISIVSGCGPIVTINYAATNGIVDNYYYDPTRQGIKFTLNADNSVRKLFRALNGVTQIGNTVRFNYKNSSQVVLINYRGGHRYDFNSSSARKQLVRVTGPNYSLVYTYGDLSNYLASSVSLHVNPSTDVTPKPSDYLASLLWTVDYGNLQQVSVGGVPESSYTYNALGQVISVTTPEGGVSLSYSGAASQLAGILSGPHSIGISRDLSGYISAITVDNVSRYSATNGTASHNIGLPTSYVEDGVSMGVTYATGPSGFAGTPIAWGDGRGNAHNITIASSATENVFTEIQSFRSGESPITTTTKEDCRVVAEDLLDNDGEFVKEQSNSLGYQQTVSYSYPDSTKTDFTRAVGYGRGSSFSYRLRLGGVIPIIRSEFLTDTTNDNLTAPTCDASQGAGPDNLGADGEPSARLEDGTEGCGQDLIGCGGVCRTSCGIPCGNGTCDAGEDCVSCSLDCGACGGFCGDNICNGAETLASCCADCARCGDGICSACDGENTATCSPDCGGGSCGAVCTPGVTTCPTSCNTCCSGTCQPVCAN